MLFRSALVAQSPITTGAGAAGLAAADFDGDTFLDVAVANRDAGTVTVLYGDGTGAFPASFSINAGGPAVAVAACRTVGAYPDLFIAVAGTRLCAAGNLRNVSTVAARSFQAPITISTGNFVDVAAGDVLATSAPEVVALNATTSTVSVYVALTQLPIAGSPFAAGTGAASITLADVNNDGKLDRKSTRLNSSHRT